MRHLTLLISACLIFISGCDVIEAPYLDPEFLAQLPADEKCLLESQEEAAFPDGYSPQKMVLLEEMTGHKCGNCPRASEVAYDLYNNVFKEQIVFLSIHAGPLASFSPNDPKYNTNFKTPAGDELYSNLNDVSAVPFGMVDRVLTGNDQSQWQGYVTDRLQEAPTAGIRIFNCYDPAADSLQLGTVIDLVYPNEANSQQRLSVYLVENEIVSYQKDYSAPNGSPDIPDYKHHYVLRGAVNGTWGQPVSSGMIEAGGRFTQSYSYSVEQDFDAEHCYIVAFVYDEGTNEVGQVAIAPIISN